MIPEIRGFLDQLGSPEPRKAIAPPSLAPVRVRRIDLHGVEGPAEELVRDLMGFTLPTSIGPEAMDAAISRVYATELFETVVYKLIPGEPGQPATIRIDLQPLEDPNNIAVGFRYDDLYSASLLFTIELRNKLRYGSTTGLVFRFGRQTHVGAEYFTRLGRTAPLTLGISTDFKSAPLRFGSVLTGRFPEDDDDRPLLRQNLLTGRVSFGYTLSNKALVGIQGRASRYTEKIQNYPITDEELLFADGQFRAPDYEGATFFGRYVSGGAFLETESFDRRAFPTRGYRVLLTAETGVAARNDDDVIERLEDVLGPLPRAPQNNTYQGFRHYVANAHGAVAATTNIALISRVGFSRGIGDGLPLNYLTAVGGIHTNTIFEGSFYPLYGLTSQERLGSNGWIAMLGAQWEFRPKYFLQVFGNAGDAYFDLDLTDAEAANDPRLAALDGFDLGRAALGLGINLGWSSPIGPVMVSAGYAEDGPLRLGFSAGYNF
jgi:outer membrane protein assembly factor BamA